MVPPASNYPIHPSNVTTPITITRTLPATTNNTTIRSPISFPLQTVSTSSVLPLAKQSYNLPVPSTYETITTKNNAYTLQTDKFSQLTYVYDSIIKN